MKKILIALAALLLLVLLPFLSSPKLRAFPGIISAFYAKEWCSCHYVMKRDETFCHNYARQFIDIDQFENNEQETTVTVQGLGVTTRAMFIGEREGCLILE